MTAGSPGLATLPQVISSMARFMQAAVPPMPNRSTGETALALKGTRSMMPGAGAIDVKSAYLRLVDGLLALYHGAAIKHAEKLCEVRDNQMDMADCLHDIELRIRSVSAELHNFTDSNGDLTDQEKIKKFLMEKILKELERSQNSEFADSLFAFVPEYHVDAALELCNTLRLYMHPTVAVQQTLASFATQPATMRAIERVPIKHQMRMVEELMRPYQNRAWAQSNWVLVRFWHGSGFGFRHRQWPHLASRYGDREPTVNNLGAKVDAGLMSQCFGPCPSEVIQCRVQDYIATHPKEAALFLNSLLNFYLPLVWYLIKNNNNKNLYMDRIQIDANLEPRQIKLCATCFDLYHGLARALEMTLSLAPTILTKPEASDGQNDLLLGRTCQILMAVVSRICVRGGGSGGFNRLVARGLPDTDRVHYYVALAPVAGCIIRMLDTKLSAEHQEKVANSLVSEPLFRLDGLQFMLADKGSKHFSFYQYPEDVTASEIQALERVIDLLRITRDKKLVVHVGLSLVIDSLVDGLIKELELLKKKKKQKKTSENVVIGRRDRKGASNKILVELTKQDKDSYKINNIRNSE
ncbi:unnamed protein product, partial [Leptidea sinapis]